MLILANRQTRKSQVALRYCACSIILYPYDRTRNAGGGDTRPAIPENCHQPHLEKKRRLLVPLTRPLSLCGKFSTEICVAKQLERLAMSNLVRVRTASREIYGGSRDLVARDAEIAKLSRWLKYGLHYCSGVRSGVRRGSPLPWSYLM
jgi:hypothetical protein